MGSNKKAATRGKGSGSSKAIRQTHYPAEAGRSQCARLLKHLRDIGPIDTREARDKLDIMSPAARIFDLRWKVGLAIEKITDPRSKVATYTLKPGGADR